MLIQLKNLFGGLNNEGIYVRSYADFLAVKGKVDPSVREKEGKNLPAGVRRNSSMVILLEHRVSNRSRPLLRVLKIARFDSRTNEYLF